MTETSRTVESEIVLAVLNAAGRIRTLLTETPEGDVCALLPGDNRSSLPTEVVLDALTQLEAEGLAVRRERVHPFDSSQYRIDWRPTNVGSAHRTS